MKHDGGGDRRRRASRALLIVVIPAVVGVLLGAKFVAARESDSGLRIVVSARGEPVLLQHRTWLAVRVGEVQSDQDTDLPLHIENHYAFPIEIVAISTTCPCIQATLPGAVTLAPRERTCIPAVLRLDGERKNTMAAVLLTLRRMATGPSPGARTERAQWTVPISLRAWLRDHPPQSEDTTVEGVTEQ